MFSYCVHVVLDLQHVECSVTDAHKQYFFKSILNTSFSKLFIFHLHPVCVVMLHCVDAGSFCSSNFVKFI